MTDARKCFKVDVVESSHNTFSEERASRTSYRECVNGVVYICADDMADAARMLKGIRVKCITEVGIMYDRVSLGW